MQKISYITAFAAAAFLSFSVSADKDTDTQLLAKALSSSYGADVAVNIDEQRCEVVYPEVTIEEEVIRDSDVPSPDGNNKTENQKVTTTLPATTAECSKIDDFNNHAQYQIKHNSPHKLLAQFYNSFELPFVKNINIKNFSEEMRFVPEIGLTSLRKIHLSDAAYTSKDETTGLKKEIGNLGNYDLVQEVITDDDKLKYQVKMDMDMLNVALPFFSLQIKSEKNVSEIEYKLPEDNSFDYANIVQNFAHIISAKSAAIGRGIKIGVNLIDLVIGLDMDIKSNTQRAENDTYYTYGTMAFNNIAIASDMIAKEKQPQAITMKYVLKDMAADSLNKFGKLQQEKNKEMEEVEDFEQMMKVKNSYDEKTAEILDEMVQKAKLNFNTDIKFADADIATDFALERRNGYLYGIGKVKVTNLYNIFPEQRKCINNPRADEIPDCKSDFVFFGIEDLIDVSKDNSETVYKYTEKGVFKNDVKIGEPIELSFKKMYLDKQQKNKEREELLRQLMEQQKTAVGVK